jgi:alpha-L-fucosidase
MDVHGEGIHGTRPWKVYGEGPSVTGEIPRGQFGGAKDVRPYTSEDMRFVKKGDTLYVFIMASPESGSTVIKSLASNSPQLDGRKVGRITLLGHHSALKWEQDEQGLNVKLPAAPSTSLPVALRIRGVV